MIYGRRQNPRLLELKEKQEKIIAESDKKKKEALGKENQNELISQVQKERDSKLEKAVEDYHKQSHEDAEKASI